MIYLKVHRPLVRKWNGDRLVVITVAGKPPGVKTDMAGYGRRHFETHFLARKCFDTRFSEFNVLFYISIWRYVSNDCLSIGLVTSRLREIWWWDVDKSATFDITSNSLPYHKLYFLFTKFSNLFIFDTFYVISYVTGAVIEWCVTHLGLVTHAYVRLIYLHITWIVYSEDKYFHSGNFFWHCLLQEVDHFIQISAC